MKRALQLSSRTGIAVALAVCPIAIGPVAAIAQQPSAITRIQQLETDVKLLKQQVAALQAEVAQLKAARSPEPNQLLRTPASQPTRLSHPAQVQKPPTPRPELPWGKKTGKPLGFRKVSMDEVGYINIAPVEHVVDSSAAVVRVFLMDEDGYGARGMPEKSLVLRGLSTAGQADDSRWVLDRWFTITSTMQYGGTTYFVAEPLD